MQNFIKRILKVLFRNFGLKIIRIKHPLEMALELLNFGKNKNLIFIDIGANKGQSVLVIKNLVKKFKLDRYSVYAFEPMEENFIELNKLKSNLIKIFPIGISDSERDFDIYHAQDSEWHSINNNDNWKKEGGRKETIKLMQLDRVLPNNKLSGELIVKIDVEGHEMEVLRGMKEHLKSKNLRIIIIEVGFNPEDKQHTYFNTISSYLFDFEFRCCHILDINSFAHPVWGNHFSIGYANAIFLKD